MPADLDQTSRVEFANKLRLIYFILVDAHITEEETEALIANNSKSIFVGNVSGSRYTVCGSLLFNILFIGYNYVSLYLS